jgi:hypothetical protein
MAGSPLIAISRMGLWYVWQGSKARQACDIWRIPTVAPAP